MITSYITLLPIYNPHAVAVDIDIAINPIPVRDKVIGLDVVAIIRNVSNDFSSVVVLLYFLYFFFNLLFFSLKYFSISLMLLIEFLRLFTSFNFFLIFLLNHLCLMVRTGIIFVFRSIYWIKNQTNFPR